MADTQKETIERLEVQISANADAFKRDMEVIKDQIAGLQSVTNETPKSFSGMTAAMTKAGLAVNVISAVVGKAVSGFTNLTKTIAKNGSEYARIKVATETVTKNLGMTTEQVNGLRNSLAESNTYGTKAEEIIKTLAMSGLVDMANGLKVVKAGTDDTIEGVGALVYKMKDLAAAAGIESAEGIDRITKFIRRGEATFADGVIEIGNLAYEYNQYATSLGKTASQLTATERAQVRLNIVNREAEKVYGTYANTMQTSAKAWDSAIAAIRTTTEMIGSYIEPVLSVLANGFFQIVGNFRTAVESSANVIKNWALKVAGYFVVLVRKIGQLLSRIPLIGKYFTGMASFSVKKLSAVSSSASGVSNNVDDIATSAEDAAKAMEKLAGFDEMNVLEDATSSGSGGASSYDGGIAEELLGGGGAELEDNADIINGYADSIERSFDKALPQIKAFAKGLLAVASAIGVMKLAWDGVKIFSQISTALPTITKLFGAFNESTIAVAGKLSLVIALFVGMYTYCDNFRNAVNNLVKNGLDILKNSFSIIVDVASIFFNIFKLITSILGEVGAVLTNGLNIELERLNKLLSVVSASVKVSATWFNTFTSTLLDNRTQEEKLTDAVEAHNRANEELIASTKELDNAQASLTEAQISLMDAEDRVAERQRIVNELEAIGDTTSREYQRAQLELKSAQDNLNRSNERVAEAEEKVKVATDNVASATDNLKNSEQELQRQTNSLDSGQAEGFAGRIKNAFNTATASIGDSWGILKSRIKDYVNRIIGDINSMIRALNRISIPANVPVLGGLKINIPEIPYLASGGVIDSPTVALLGEAGREAVVPLENTDWIDKLAEKINGNGNQELTIKIGEETIYSGFVDYINDKAMRTGTKLLTI